MEARKTMSERFLGLVAVVIAAVVMAGVTGGFSSVAWAADAPAAAYAVYYTDRSLIFQTDDEAYEDKTISKVYEVDIEGTGAPAWSEIASRVTSVSVAEWMYTHSTANWFKGFEACTAFDLNYLVTNKCTNMSNMFAGATKVQRISLLNQRTSEVTTMESMFEGCTALKYVLMPQFDTSKVTNFQNMFNNCKALYMLDLSSFSNEAATNCNNMLANLASLRGVMLGRSFDLQTKASEQAACGLAEPITPAVYLASDAWYDSTGKAYTSVEIPANTAQMYSAYKSGTIYMDVPAHMWFAEPVTAASEMGYVSGLGGSVGRGAQFNPYGTLSRCEMAQILALMAGVNLASYRDVESFTDIELDQWYAPAVAWAKENKITTGYAGGDTFRPFDPVYRQEYAVFLARYAELMGKTTITGYDTSILARYSDGKKVSPWAEEAVAWALDNKIMGQNADDPMFYPILPVTRSQAATMSWRYQPYFLINGVEPSELSIPTGELPPVKPTTPDDDENQNGNTNTDAGSNTNTETGGNTNTDDDTTGGNTNTNSNTGSES